MRRVRPAAIVHCAAQPSHDLAASRPFDDFDVNAGGTLAVLEAARQFAPEAPFVHMGTNKVYGDAPNEIPLTETDTRWDYADPRYVDGIDESFRVDQSKHSIFGASEINGSFKGRYAGFEASVVRDGAKPIRASVGDVVMTIVLGVLLTILVVLCFLEIFDRLSSRESLCLTP